MKGDKLYRGIGDADEKYIKSAEKAYDSGEKHEKIKNTGRIIKRIVSIAAAVVIIGGLWVVSFIVTQKRQDPNTAANTGESADTEYTSVSDVTQAADPVQIDPESECGKMMQAFDAYLKAKESGKYGDYYVSYCVKVNGAYIGFINDGETDYTDALELRVVDGLPFYYGNGQELTVINGGEYRYGLEKAYNDGLLSSNDIDEFFIKYSSYNLYTVYENLIPEFLGRSCDEVLNGETVYDVNLSEKRTVTLYNYIDIPFCYKISDAKYAVLYQILHDPVEDSVNEYYDITAGDHVFSVRVGQRFNIIDGGEIYVLDKAGLSEKELSDLFGYYSRHLIQSKNPETEIYKYGIEKYLESGKTTAYADYSIIYAYKTSKGTYIAKIMLSNKGYMPYVSTEEIAGITITYTSSVPFTVIKGDELCVGLSKAYEKGLITADEIKEMNEDYQSVYKIKELFDSFIKYRTSQGNNVLYAYKTADGVYIGIMEYGDAEVWEETVAGYTFEHSNGNKFLIIKNDTLIEGIDAAYERGVISADTLREFYEAYTKYEKIKTPDTTDTQFIDVEFEWLDFKNTDRITDGEKAKELSGVFDEYLRGEQNPGIDFCVKLGNGKYAALLNRHIGIICIDSTENVCGYPLHYSGYRKMTVLYGDTAYYGLQNAYEHNALTDNDAYKIYTAYRNAFSAMYIGDVDTPSEQYRNMRYAIDLYYNDSRVGNEYNGYNVYYAKVVGDTYFAFIDDGTVSYTADVTMKGTAGYMFTYYDGKRFTALLKDGQIVYGLDEAYEKGLVSEEEIGELFRDYHDKIGRPTEFSENYLLKTSFEEYLDGASERDATNRPENAKNITFYNQVKILFCMKLEGGGYAAIFDKYGDTIDKTAYYTTETAQGYEFFYNFGNVIRVLDGNGLTSLPDSDLSKEEVYSVLRAYISFYNTFYDRATITTALFESFIQTGTSWENNVYYAYKTSDGAYIGLMAYGDAEHWEETVAGYTFEHHNGNKFLVIKDGALTEGLSEAYDAGVISDATVLKLYFDYNNLEDDQDNSGYETTVYMMRANRDGHGVSTKTVSTCDLAYSIIDALGDLHKTGEIADKTSDDTEDEYTEHIFSEAERGMLWLQVGSKLYRVSSDLSKIALVDSHFDKGYVLNMTAELKKLLNDAWYYFPYDTYTGTYDNTENKTEINHVYTADSTVAINVKKIIIEKSLEPNNSITLEVTSSLDQYVPIYLNCYQSDDNLAAGDRKELNLKAGETKQFTLKFGGWENFRFWIDVIADNTRVTLTIDP